MTQGVDSLMVTKMPVSVIAIKHGAGLFPATDNDQAELEKVKSGVPLRLEITQQSDRSLQHHRLFYGGLVKLTLDYYQPTHSLVTERDKRLVKHVLKTVGVDKIGAEQANEVYRHVMRSIQQSRASKIDLQPMDKSAFVDWLKIQVGHFDSVKLPDGSVLQKPRSINFNAMNQSEFNAFYKACFNVCWQLVLSTQFGSEDECQKVIDQLSMMG